MANWKDLSEDALAAAKLLLARGHFRSCVARAYYAAYSRAVSLLSGMKGVTFRYGWRNPAHQQLPGLIRDRLTGVSEGNRQELLRIIRRLRMARVDADYRPYALVNQSLARNMVRDASLFFRILEKAP